MKRKAKSMHPCGAPVCMERCVEFQDEGFTYWVRFVRKLSIQSCRLGWRLYTSTEVRVTGWRLLSIRAIGFLLTGIISPGFQIGARSHVSKESWKMALMIVSRRVFSNSEVWSGVHI